MKLIVLFNALVNARFLPVIDCKIFENSVLDSNSGHENRDQLIKLALAKGQIRMTPICLGTLVALPFAVESGSVGLRAAGIWPLWVQPLRNVDVTVALRSEPCRRRARRISSRRAVLSNRGPRRQRHSAPPSRPDPARPDDGTTSAIRRCGRRPSRCRRALPVGSVRTSPYRRSGRDWPASA